MLIEIQCTVLIEEWYRQKIISYFICDIIMYGLLKELSWRIRFHVSKPMKISIKSLAKVLDIDFMARAVPALSHIPVVSSSKIEGKPASFIHTFKLIIS